MLKKTKSSNLIAVIIAVVALLWVGSGVLFPSSDGKEPEHAAGENGKTEIITVRIREMTAENVVNDVIVTGRTQASRTVTVKAETEGRIEALELEEGEAVEEGAVIAHIEERGRKARLAEAQERVSQREIEFSAAKSLEAKGFNSKVRLAQATADLETAKAELEEAQADLDNIDIKAPFGGVINDQYIEIGDYLGKGDPVVTLVDTDPIEITGYVTESQVLQLDAASKARAVFVDGTVVEGTLSYVAPAANPDTRTFRVEISVPNPSMAIVDGMTARIEIPVAEKKAHKISPSILSLNDAGQIGVKIVNDEDRVEFAPIRILADTKGFMWVGGLPEKSRIITVGQDYVVPGQLVKPVPSDKDGLL